MGKCGKITNIAGSNVTGIEVLKRLRRKKEVW
jgi:hypothetical protein